MLTYNELFQEFIARHARYHLRGWKDLEANHRRYFKAWRKVRVVDIQRADILEWMNLLADNVGAATANRNFHTFRAVINWGVQNDLLPSAFTPERLFRKIPLFRTKRRQRFLLPDELDRFCKAIHQEPPGIAKDVLLMLLYTFTRKSNVLQMRWDQIDWELRLWSIPHTKNGDPLVLPLPADALALLAARKAAPDSHPVWVFPGNSARGHFVDPKRAFRRICEKAGITNLRIHDLRHTGASYMAMSGVSLLVIGKALGHRSRRSTEVYAHLLNEPVQRAFEAAHQVMFKQ